MAWSRDREFLVRAQVRATPSTGRRGAAIAGSQTDAPQFVIGARFGEAALAGVQEGQAHVFIL